MYESEYLANIIENMDDEFKYPMQDDPNFRLQIKNGMSRYTPATYKILEKITPNWLKTNNLTQIAEIPISDRFSELLITLARHSNLSTDNEDIIKNVMHLKYAILGDTFFLAFFPSYVKALSEQCPNDYWPQVKIELTASCKQAILEMNGMSEKSIENIIDNVSYLCSDPYDLYNDKRFKLILSIQLIPLMLFIAANLRSNDLPKTENVWDKNYFPKYAKIAWMLFDTHFNLNNYPDLEIERKRYLFLINAIKGDKNRVLSGTDQGLEKYKKKYSKSKSITKQLFPNSESQKPLIETESGNGTDYQWVCEHFYNCSLPLYNFELFKEILHSNVTVGNTTLKINKSINLELFNSLTGLLDLQHGDALQYGINNAFPGMFMTIDTFKNFYDLNSLNHMQFDDLQALVNATFDVRLAMEDTLSAAVSAQKYKPITYPPSQSTYGDSYDPYVNLLNYKKS